MTASPRAFDGHENITGDATPVEPYGLRPEIWTAAKKDFEAGDFDKAIFASFKHVESAIQQQSGLTSIGKPLVEAALGGRIRIRGSKIDLDSLAAFMSGSIGFFRGPRAHGATPPVSVVRESKCLRVLNVASAILDLLDEDEQVRPRIIAIQPAEDSLEILAANLSATTDCSIDGEVIPIVARSGSTVIVQVDGLEDGAHRLALADDRHTSDDWPFTLRRGPKELGWHRVKRAGIPVFAADTGAVQIAGVTAVHLESNEAGRRIERYFPTATTYDVGDYVTWSWEMGTVVGEGWIASPGTMKRIPAWSGSALFAGAPSTPLRPAGLDSIRLFPEYETSLSPGDWALARVVGLYSDGIGAWETPVIPESLEVDNLSTAFVDKCNVLHAKAFGDAVVSARFDGMFCKTALNVVAGKAGDSRYFLGGLPRVSGVAVGRGGVFITDQSDTVYFGCKSKGLSVFTKVASASPGVAGMDGIACSSTGDLYVRHVGNRSILHFASQENTKYTDVRLPNDRSPTGITAIDSILYITDSRGSVWMYRDGDLRELCSVTSEEDGGYTLTHAAVIGASLFVFDNRNALFEINRETGKYTVQRVPGAANRVSSCTSVKRELLVTDFHDGTLSKFVRGTMKVVANGFVNPTGISAENSRSAFVCNFGAGTIDRVIL